MCQVACTQSNSEILGIQASRAEEEAVGETLVREEAGGGWAWGERGAVPEMNANSQ